MSRQTCGEFEVKLHTFHLLRYKLCLFFLIVPPITALYRTEILHPPGYSVAAAHRDTIKETLCTWQV